MPLKKCVKRFLSGVLLMLLLASCQIFQPKRGGVDRLLLLYTVISPNLVDNIAQDVTEVKSSIYLPEYFDEKGSGNIMLFLEYKEGGVPVLKRLFRDEFGVASEETLMEYEGRDGVEPELLGEILEYIETIFKPQEKGIIFSGHGQGWLPSGFFNSPVGYSGVSAYKEEVDPYAHLVKGFGYSQKQEMDIIRMAQVIPSGFAYIIFDSCLMGGIEIMYELKNKTQYIISSPTEIMGGGFPYMQTVDYLFHPTASLLSRMRGVAESYYNYYSDVSTGGCTISLVETGKLDQVAQAAKVIFDTDRKKIKTIDVDNVQKYFRMNKHWFYDFISFIEEISSVPAQTEALKKSLDDAVVVKFSTDKFLNLSIKEFSGVSTYIPSPPNAFLDDYYKSYQWNKDAQMIK